MITKLKLRRVMRDIKQSELAHKAKVSQSYLSGVETGIIRPGRRFMRKISKALRIKEGDLF